MSTKEVRCVRCGIERTVHESRPSEGLCRDCYATDPLWRRIILRDRAAVTA